MGTYHHPDFIRPIDLHARTWVELWACSTRQDVFFNAAVAWMIEKTLSLLII